MSTLVIAKKARATLQRMPRNTAKRIRQKIDAYMTDPENNQHMVKRIFNTDTYRLRVGDWRVLFKQQDGFFYVSDIVPRGSAYKR